MVTPNSDATNRRNARPRRLARRIQSDEQGRHPALAQRLWNNDAFQRLIKHHAKVIHDCSWLRIAAADTAGSEIFDDFDSIVAT
jgi:hypothetical protein